MKPGNTMGAILYWNQHHEEIVAKLANMGDGDWYMLLPSELSQDDFELFRGGSKELESIAKEKDFEMPYIELVPKEMNLEELIPGDFLK